MIEFPFYSPCRAVCAGICAGLSVPAFIFCLLILLSACAGPQAPRAVCPVIVPYSLSDDRALDAALRAHPSDVVDRYLRDYAGLRDQVRACASN